jgi:proteic killer suppression protein
MIKTFRNQVSADIAQGMRTKTTDQKLPPELHRNALLKMALINRAKTLIDLNAKGLRLEKLRGDRKGSYSIRINQQYRVCFEWRNDGVYNVEVVDYH